MQAKAKKRILDLLNSLIQEGTSLQQTQRTQTHLAGFEIANPTTYVDLQAASKWHAGCDVLLGMLGNAGEPWKEKLTQSGNRLSLIKSKVGLLQGISVAVEGDLLVSVEDLIRSEMFDDLIEQAEHLHEQHYWLAAGVLGRAVLEEHLRKWCDKAGCAPAKTKPTLNDFMLSLFGHNHIDKIKMKHIEALAAVGNECAHNTGKATEGDVERLLRDVRDFLVKNPV